MSESNSAPLGRRERFLKNVAGLAVRLIYRSVEVRQRPGETSAEPQLSVSNHFGGFADALIQAYALDRVPRYVARDVIWRYPGAKQAMGFVRAIPTHKPDDEGPAGNDQMFSSAYDTLGEGDLVMIFPEGITVDDPSIARVKTGAARIALGARASGVEGIQIIPSGIHYDNKASLRSKVWVNVGAPLDLDAEIHRYVQPGETEDASNRDAVRALTADIEQRLRRSAPDYRDWEEERTLSTAASIALRTVPGAPIEVDFGDESELANVLSQRSPQAKGAITAAVERYLADLDAVGLNDQQLATTHRTRRSFLWRIIWNLLVGLVLLPFAARRPDCQLHPVRRYVAHRPGEDGSCDGGNSEAGRSHPALRDHLGDFRLVGVDVVGNRGLGRRAPRDAALPLCPVRGRRARQVDLACLARMVEGASLRPLRRRAGAPKGRGAGRLRLDLNQAVSPLRSCPLVQPRSDAGTPRCSPSARR